MALPVGTATVHAAHWLFTQEYTFVHKGDVLPIHNHPQQAANHLTIVVAGSVVVHGTQEGRVLSAGDIATWQCNEDHGFEALTDGARVVNIRVAWAAEVNADGK